MLRGKANKKVYIIHHSTQISAIPDLQEQVIYKPDPQYQKVITLLKRGYEANLPEKSSGGTVKPTTVWNGF